ncbi:MAG: ribonuclease III [bacterium]|nr:ribonuclease III [bacterium]
MFTLDISPALLEQALRHRSALSSNETYQRLDSNERLEFLGDAVLELATTNFLYRQFPQELEGTLTSYRSSLVKTTTLARVARKLEIGDAIIMSKGEAESGGRDNDGLLADTFEALVGALYLNSGFPAVESFLGEHLFIEFDTILKEGTYKDAKSELQELVQADNLAAPTYRVTQEEGPDHDKEFTVEVRIGGKSAATGIGKSKQQAQQDAAEKALKQYKT